ncbi:gluconate 2-dehydrogenase subunit 3 family protein [Mycobacterium sp.]|uniref:gluconate 2-dehydrogenase subunit 3 family protein n=1 Tax=Mycobacterium sp. TaxID=1785 RepID=UPI0025F66DC0|nr:gluconate 2-dehydrogenase subunit 3 family protein [Mycobacterium sp.]MBW0015775.1 gluconate 2-dehydrogenase subunit 3 family protein [Mycobacterium sp.]
MPSQEAAPTPRLAPAVSRRVVLGGLSLLPLAATLPRGIPAASAAPGYRFLTPHQAAVLDAATRRLIPGPEDCPAELGSPGAHEANVVNYLDRMLSVFDVTPPDVHAGGPWSNRAGGSADYMATFVPLNRAQTYAWRQRIMQLRSQYNDGIAMLDRQAGGDFTAVKPERQDVILVHGQVLTFTKLLFGHTIEAMYSNPEYGGNANLVGWKDIKFPGDSQPRGYSPAEVEAAHLDVVVVTDIIDRVRHGWEQLIAKLGGKGGVGAGR